MNYFTDRIRTGTPLKELTTIGIGGPARYYFRVTSTEELRTAIAWAKKEGVPLFVMGGGSNVLFPDAGFPGLVLHMEIRGRSEREEKGFVMVKVMAGEDWDDFVAYSVARGWAGIECLSGIPGKVGAAPIQNIGAYGREVAETLVETEVLDLETLEDTVIPKAACGFGYRQSIFKGAESGRYIVTAVILRLQKNGTPIIRYPDLEKRLRGDATLSEVRRAVLAVRREKSMVVDPEDPNSRSCGSFFTNPILDKRVYHRFAEEAPENHPRYPAGPDRVKLSAAWLIEQSGFSKGYVKGNVGLSAKHCLAVINRGGGTAVEVMALVSEIRDIVYLKFGIILTPEPVLP